MGSETPSQYHQRLQRQSNLSGQPPRDGNMPCIELVDYMAFCHILLLILFLEAQIYQHFHSNHTASRAPTRAEPRTFPTSIWFSYLGFQHIVSILLAFTYPYVAGGGKLDQSLGVSKNGSRLTTTVPLVLMVVLTAVNVYSSNKLQNLQTGSVREKKEGKEGKEEAGSPQLKILNNKLLTFHRATYACNIAITALSLWYTFCVVGRSL